MLVAMAVTVLGWDGELLVRGRKAGVAVAGDAVLQVGEVVRVEGWAPRWQPAEPLS